jgi:hypothetical protein
MAPKKKDFFRLQQAQPKETAQKLFIVRQATVIDISFP